jgi:glyoxylase-like metal-dependent hydrolase (beta-lactamase superfamily II)
MSLNIPTIDLRFQGLSNTIGVFLVPHDQGGLLVESGPSSTLSALVEGIAAQGLTPADISDVFVTHIHLDHAGASGWWARQGARIHVHEIGAPHLLNPARLIASASRIYGDMMDMLWGEFLPVPPEKLNILYDRDEIEVGGLSVRALDTPGHANHHMAYIINGVCFTGDVGGVRLPGIKSLRLPTVPPELHIEKWRGSIQKLRCEEIQAIAPTHFGVHTDVEWHLTAVEDTLDRLENWMDEFMPANPTRDEMQQKFADWMHQQAVDAGISTETIHVLDLAISSQMSADGIYRYWHKVRNPQA